MIDGIFFEFWSPCPTCMVSSKERHRMLLVSLRNVRVYEAKWTSNFRILSRYKTNIQIAVTRSSFIANMPISNNWNLVRASAGLALLYRSSQCKLTVVQFPRFWCRQRPASCNKMTTVVGIVIGSMDEILHQFDERNQAPVVQDFVHQFVPEIIRWDLKGWITSTVFVQTLTSWWTWAAKLLIVAQHTPFKKSAQPVVTHQVQHRQTFQGAIHFKGMGILNGCASVLARSKWTISFLEWKALMSPWTFVWPRCSFDRLGDFKYWMSPVVKPSAFNTVKEKILANLLSI